MSASREKKQRQSAGPDQKTVKVQQEQAARRRTTIVYSVIAAVIAVLVAALLVWRSGFFQARASAATVGDETLTAAELSFYYYNARQSTAMYGSYVGFDTTKSDDEQFFNESEGKTYRDTFLEQALTTAQQHKAMADEAVKNGHTESEVKDQLNDAIANAKQQAASNGYTYGAYLKAMYGPYMSTGIYEKLYTRYLMYALAMNSKGEELYSGFTQAKLDAYYEENKDSLDTFEYSHLYFPADSVDTKDAEGNDLSEDEVAKLKEEALAEAKEKAEEAMEAIKDGADFQSQISKYELTTGGDHVTVVGSSSINATYRDQLLKQDKGDVDMVETDSGYYIISFSDRYLSDEPTRDVRHILARAESTTGEDNKLVAPTDEAWAAAKAKMDEIQAAWDASGKTEDDFAKLANEKSDDGDGTTGGLYERNTEGYFVPEFNDWVFDAARKSGDVGMVQHSAEEGAASGYYGYHLIYYVGENEPVWMGTARNSLASEAQQAWVDELTAGYATALADGANYLGK